MSNHPTYEVKTRKAYTSPTVTKLHLTDAPSPEVVDTLRSALKQLEKSLRLEPNDLRARELQRSIRRKLDELEPERIAKIA